MIQRKPIADMLYDGEKNVGQSINNCDYLLHKELHQPLIPHVFNVSYSNNGTWPWKNYELRDNSFQLGFANCSNNGTMTGLADQIVSAGTSDYSSSTGEWGMQSQVFVQKKMLLRWDWRSGEAIWTNINQWH